MVCETQTISLTPWSVSSQTESKNKLIKTFIPICEDTDQG
ncbi:hypothetical protein FHT21_004550 [Pedobacter sp. SG908]|nr:hypothetical protein [Pedobacter sp. SG908]NMN39662.1 hypothetical protein [Pedobacter sp. SG918]